MGYDKTVFGRAGLTRKQRGADRGGGIFDGGMVGDYFISDERRGSGTLLPVLIFWVRMGTKFECFVRFVRFVRFFLSCDVL